MATTFPRALVIAISLLPAWCILSIHAGEPEMREMAIFVDGKRSGESHVTVEQREDGSTQISTTADVAVDALLFRYKFSYRGMEVWKDGKLLKMQSNTNDNGKKISVSAVADSASIQLRVGNKERQVRADVWTTSYMRYPDLSRCDKTVALLDADSGKEITAKMQLIGKEELVVAGNKMTCEHFRLSGGVTTDLWYDGQKKLVRQESVESGHKLLIELSASKR
jgi:hypothetical protein